MLSSSHCVFRLSLGGKVGLICAAKLPGFYRTLKKPNFQKFDRQNFKLNATFLFKRPLICIILVRNSISIGL